MSYSNQKKISAATDELIQMPAAVDDNKRLGRVLEKKMSALTFLRFVLIFSVIGIICIVSINVWIDIYGLFRPVKNRAIPVYNNDRISKFLLSYRYIPENFNVAIVGTSLSANLDVREFNHRQGKFRFYNTSVMGANISELSPIAQNLVKGGIKKMIICFSPYMTKNSGTKEVELGPKIYYGAFGSKNLFETYAVAVIRKYELMPGKFPKNQIDEFGVNHYQDFFKVDDIKQKIASTIEENKNQSIPIDPVALQELKTLLAFLKANDVSLIGYFHPVPAEILESKFSDYQNFQQTVSAIINDDSRLINLNNTDFKHFTSDYSNYIDHGHLSQKGQKIVTEILFEKLESLNNE